MKYLVSVKDTLTDEEMNKLRHTAAFPVETPADPDGSKPPIVRKKPFELYEPVQQLRELDLPILDWGEGKWQKGSEEGALFTYDRARQVTDCQLECCSHWEFGDFLPLMSSLVSLPTSLTQIRWRCHIS